MDSFHKVADPRPHIIELAALGGGARTEARLSSGHLACFDRVPADALVGRARTQVDNHVFRDARINLKDGA